LVSPEETSLFRSEFMLSAGTRWHDLKKDTSHSWDTDSLVSLPRFQFGRKSCHGRGLPLSWMMDITIAVFLLLIFCSVFISPGLSPALPPLLAEAHRTAVSLSWAPRGETSPSTRVGGADRVRYPFPSPFFPFRSVRERLKIEIRDLTFAATFAG